MIIMKERMKKEEIGLEKDREIGMTMGKEMEKETG
jgi:hypothetical protein